MDGDVAEVRFVDGMIAVALRGSTGGTLPQKLQHRGILTSKSQSACAYLRLNAMDLCAGLEEASGP